MLDDMKKIKNAFDWMKLQHFTGRSALNNWRAIDGAADCL